MKQLLEKIIDGEFFSEEEAIMFIETIDKKLLSDEQIAGILVGIQMRGLQLDELRGFRKALLSLSESLNLNGEDAIDLCGTGGDGKDTFNISTTTSLVLAAMGKKVIKHGNYGVSSLCGSSNVLEALGFDLTNDEAILQRNLDESNIAILHAPLFHPCMKNAAPIRKSLAVKSLFNALGPLVNPVQPAYQVTGTFSLELAHMYQHVLKGRRKHFKVLYGMDGYDELTLTDSTRVISDRGESVRRASSFAIADLSPSDLQGGKSIEESAKMVVDVLKGKAWDSHLKVVSANVAEALTCFDPEIDLKDAYKEASDFIASGQAAKHFNFS